MLMSRGGKLKEWGEFEKKGYVYGKTHACASLRQIVQMWINDIYCGCKTHLTNYCLILLRTMVIMKCCWNWIFDLLPGIKKLRHKIEYCKWTIQGLLLNETHTLQYKSSYFQSVLSRCVWFHSLHLVCIIASSFVLLIWGNRVITA